MRVWRLARRPFLALDGEGARLAGGRWNSEGAAVVYTSSSLSLAALEYLTHLDPEEAPADLVALEIEVPDDAVSEKVQVRDLPSGWNTVFDDPACLAIGDAWLTARRALVLEVPSAVIPEETNALLNPAHPDAVRLRVVSTRPFAFDHRLL